MRWWVSILTAAAFHECPVDQDECQSIASVELSGLWALDPATLVYDDHPTSLDMPIGFVSMNGTLGKYTLSNDINFSLQPDNETEGFTVSITGETAAAVEGAEAVGEELIRAVFLHEGNKIGVLPVGRDRVLVASSRGSVQLVPLPRLAEGLIPKADELDGVWISSVADEDTAPLPLRLHVIHTFPRKLLFSLEGVNTHHIRVDLGPAEQGLRSIVVEPAFSTSLVADNTKASEMEIHLVRLLELCNRLALNGNTLEMWNTAKPDLRVVFYRPKFSARLFRESPAAYWAWMPDTADGFNLPEGLGNVPVMLQVRQATETATIMDVFADTHTHLRAVVLETAQPGSPPLRAVQHLSNGDHPDLGAVLLDLLQNVQSLDVDASGVFLSLVTQDNKSLAFESVPYPSPGIWVLDNRYTTINGSLVVAESYIAHQVRLKIEQRETGSVHASLLGQESLTRVDFVVRNSAPWPSEQKLMVTSVARRPGVTTTNRQGQVDDLVANFFHDGILVEMHRGDAQTLIRFSDAFGNSFVFIHGIELTAALAGQWTRTGDESLRLVPSGVGEMRGLIRFSNGEISRLRLREAPSDEIHDKEDSVIPSHWTVEEHRASLKASPKLKAALKEIAGDAKFELFPGKSMTVKMKSKTQMEISHDNAKPELWSRTLPPSVKHHIEGDWFVEFVAVETKNGTAVVASQADAAGRLLIALQLDDKQGEAVDLSISHYMGRLLELPSRRLLLNFTVAINPFAVLQVTELKEVAESGIATAVQPQLETRLVEFFTAAANTDLFRVEASASEMTLSDGGNVLVLSRGVPSQPVSMPLLLIWEGALSTGPSSDVIVYSQMPQHRRLQDTESDRADPLAMRMMANYRRRLLAATNLDSYLRD